MSIDISVKIYYKGKEKKQSETQRKDVRSGDVFVLFFIEKKVTSGLFSKENDPIEKN